MLSLCRLSPYIYAKETERKNRNLIFAGLAFWGMYRINEIINSLILHFTGYATLRTAS
jgi:hypothetical protein